MRYLPCLILVISLVLFALGCDEDTDLQETELTTVSVTPSGGDIFPNSVVTVAFSHDILPPIIMLNHTQVAAITTDNKVLTFTPTEHGSAILTIDTGDEAGQRLTGFKPIQFTVGAGDWGHPAELVGGKRNPEDGAAGVDPAEYPEKLVLAFSEPLMEAEVLSTNPEFPFTVKLTLVACYRLIGSHFLYGPNMLSYA